MEFMRRENASWHNIDERAFTTGQAGQRDGIARGQANKIFGRPVERYWVLLRAQKIDVVVKLTIAIDVADGRHDGARFPAGS